MTLPNTHNSFPRVMPLQRASVLLSASLLACGPLSEYLDPSKESQTPQVVPPQGDSPTYPSPDLTNFGPGIHRFESDASFQSFMKEYAAKLLQEERDQSKSSGIPSGATESAAPVSDGATNAPNEDITNNQEAGVDEGGIVKNIGDHLIVLRRGSLYAVDTTAGQALRQSDGIPVASTAALNSGVWYDEMLVRGNRIAVIGYRYSQAQLSAEVTFSGSTEITTFQLVEGRLQRVGSVFVESFDYFSGSNYTSRSLGNEIVLQTPSAAFQWSAEGQARTLRIPRLARLNAAGELQRVNPLFTGSDVFLPIELKGYPLFQSIVRCNWESVTAPEGLNCGAVSILTNWSQSHYVSPTHFFTLNQNHLYAYAFESGALSTHRFEGQVRDQFSFSHRGDTLRVFSTRWEQLKDEDGDDTATSSAALSAEPASGWIGGGWGRSGVRHFDLSQIPLDAFNTTGAQDPAEHRTTLATRAGDVSVTKQRFHGEHLVIAFRVWADNRGWADNQTEMESIHLPSGQVANLSLGMNTRVTRLEPFGPGRLLVASQSWRTVGDGTGKQEQSLNLQSLQLDSVPLRVTSTFAMDNTAEGENRSHGFFFKPSAADPLVGRLALPTLSTRPANGGVWNWWNSAANIQFFDVSADGTLSSFTQTASTPLDPNQDKCQTSCVDWYGNTRPIFLRDRMLALMGSELVEVDAVSGAEASRLRLFLTPR